MQSLLGPDKILGSSTRKVDASSFSKFMMGSGQNPLQNNSFNNIVNFNRTKIDPGVSSAPSLINSISNVVNNLKTEAQNEVKIITQNLIQNVNKNIANIVNNLKSETQNEIKNISNVISNLKSETQNEIKNISQRLIQNSKTINQNSFINLQDKIQNTLNSTIQNFTQDYQKKIQEAIDNKPSNILKNFLGLYKNVVDYITFFGDPKNNKRIETSFKSLRKIFNESFDTALVIRQAIVRIVRQLSNLPSASGNAPDLNLDVNVPGGKLKQSGASSIGKFARSPMGKALAIGGAVAGGVGLGVAGSSMIEDAKRRQEEKLRTNIQVKGRESGQTVPESLMDSLEKIIENFSDAIKRLVEASKKKSGVGMSSSTPSSPSAPPGPPGSLPSTSGVGTQEQQAMLKAIRFAEGTPKSYGTIFGGNVVKELEEGKLTVQEVINMAGTGRLPKRLGGGAIPGYGSGSKATGAYQFMPPTLEDLIRKGALNPNELFTPQVQDRAALQLATDKGVTAELLKREGFSANVSNKLSPVWAAVPKLGGGSYYPDQSAKSLSDIQKIYNQSLNESKQRQSTEQLNRPNIQTPLQGKPQDGPGITTSRGGAQETSSITPNSQTTPSVAVVSAPPVPPVPSNITQSPSTSATRGSGSSSEIASLNNVIPITIPDTQQSPGANVVAEASGGTANSVIAFLEPFDFSQPNQCLALAYCNVMQIV